MFSAQTVILVVSIYMALLFALALWVEHRTRHRSSSVMPGWVYALSMAVFFTSWTFYGSVGFAVHSGPLFLAIYVGALISVLFWPVTLRRMVAVKEAFRITSIADFISTRYRRSQKIAALVTVIALSGIAPYIALQLTAIVNSFSIITGELPQPGNWDFNGFLVTGIMLLFTIVFGIRHLDPTERHSGMIAVLVAECLVKLGAFLAVGIFITFGIHGGFSNLLLQLQERDITQLTQFGATPNSGMMWMTLIVLGFAAVQLLPRQFHVGVVESSDQRHVKTAVWLFPLYLILINIFVLPIAAAGLLLGLPAESADFFVLLVPQLLGQDLITLLAYIGGFSAATGMVIISTMTLSTMTSNHLILPICERVSLLEPLRGYLLQIRWVIAACILFSAYVLAMVLSNSYILVAMGLISFVAVLQFLPVVFGGMFWRHGNSLGALLGLLAGYLIWGWTLIIPSMIQEGWLPEAILHQGPLGIVWLKPQAFLGLEGLPPVVHSVIWSLSFNLLFYVLGSWFFSPSKEERTLSREFMAAMLSRGKPSGKARPTGLDAYVAFEPKFSEAQDLLTRYLGADKTDEALAKIADDLQVTNKSYITVIELMEFHRMLEQVLAGSIGAASAHAAMVERIQYSEREAADLKALYSHLVNELQGQLRQDAEPSQHSGYMFLDQMQSQIDELEHTISQQEKKIKGLEEKLDKRFKQMFRYRVEAQKARVETENLKRKLLEVSESDS
ncbi:solute carrier 5/6 family protein [Nitrincola tapanii]|uniref:Uncharacterized protein n=1 Tax=Nitrincola tapanii TaxID=1708751 RepID=A0A5A9W3C6_9GAMM|nr:hypothetical protein [Nitrincola tapanii]KAA0875043.1 hypothetical protein E1H14_06385 [Nitrincola tapanii]